MNLDDYNVSKRIKEITQRYYPIYQENWAGPQNLKGYPRQPQRDCKHLDDLGLCTHPEGLGELWRNSYCGLCCCHDPSYGTQVSCPNFIMRTEWRQNNGTVRIGI
jgi:hypothetical protein